MNSPKSIIKRNVVSNQKQFLTREETGLKRGLEGEKGGVRRESPLELEKKD